MNNKDWRPLPEWEIKETWQLTAMYDHVMNGESEREHYRAKDEAWIKPIH